MRLTAYGHSWVAGDGASRPSSRFVDLAARRLGYVPTNLGVGGSASTDTADQLTRQPPPPSELYVVMTGLNDARRYGASSEPIESYAAALQAIFDTLTRATPAARVIVMVQPHLLDYSLHEPHNSGSDQILDAYNEQLRAVASRSAHVLLATVPDWVAATMLDEDTVHPNDAGHAALARAVVRVAGAR